jgi:hypothetical protein
MWITRHTEPLFRRMRALGEAEKGRVMERLIVCRTAVPYRLADGTWVVNVGGLLTRLGKQARSRRP